jgi:hypothetical protein
MKRLLLSQILNGSCPDQIFNVQARYTLFDSEFVSNLPFEGYVQSNAASNSLPRIPFGHAASNSLHCILQLCIQIATLVPRPERPTSIAAEPPALPVTQGLKIGISTVN